MNLVQLKYFQAICSYGSVSEASEYLYISQPSLSNAIKELEKEFGVALFNRCHKGMALTKEGEKLFELSSKLLANANEVERIMLDVGKSKKTLKLGVPPMLGSKFLPKIFKEFNQNDEFNIEVTESGSVELIKALDEDKIDVAFITHNLPLSNFYKSITVANYNIVCCVAKNSNLKDKNIITPKDIENEKIILLKNSFFQTEEIKKWFKVAGVKPRVILQTDQLSTLNNMIEKGLAIGFMFKEFVGDKNILSIPIKEPINAKISIAWKAEAGVFNTMKNFINYVKASSF